MSDPTADGGAVSQAPEAIRERVKAHPLWYHSLELAPGLVTPGWFDIRPVVDRYPWPDLEGKRCLDVGTYDGFLAFEMERRGAAEVVATDIADHEDWDWPPVLRGWGPRLLGERAGETKGRGFEIARDALGSSAERRFMSVYDLSPETVGRFDVVVCGALMLHLRDPLAALEAIRSVCDGHFLSVEQISLRLSLQHRTTPVARLDGVSQLVQWWVPNAAGHRRMVQSAGFEIVERTGHFTVPFGSGHKPLAPSFRRRARDVVRRAFAGGDGVPYSAVLARPLDLPTNGASASPSSSQSSTAPHDS